MRTFIEGTGVLLPAWEPIEPAKEEADELLWARERDDRELVVEVDDIATCRDRIMPSSDFASGISLTIT